MELDSIRDLFVKSMTLLEIANEELDSLQTRSDEELKIKKYISKEIKSVITKQLILVDNIYEVQEIIEDRTGMNTLTDILFENELKMQVN